MIDITPPSPDSIKAALNHLGKERLRWAWIGEGRLDIDLSSVGSKLDIQGRINKVSFALRQAYIDYAGQISKEQPRDWWRSAVSEKNPYISNTYLHACCIKACLESAAGEDSNFLFIVRDRALRRALYGNFKDAGFEVRLFEPAVRHLRTALRRVAGVLAHQAYFIFGNAKKIACARYWYRLHRLKPVRALQSRRTPICITNIWIDLRAYSPDTGEFKDLDFSGVSAFLRARGKTVVGLANILNSASYRKVARYIAHSDSAYLVPHSFLRMRDIFTCILLALTRVPHRRDFPAFHGMQIGDLIFSDLQDDWYRQREAEHVLIERWVARLKQSGIQVERFIYTFENHTWERVICNSLRTAYPSIRLIGYQPNGLPLLLLNHFISGQELNSIPLPDRIVANGEYTAKVLAESGLGYERVVLGGGLRQMYLQARLYGGTTVAAVDDRRPATDRRNQPQVLVTPSIGRYRTVELIHKVVEAFRSKPDVTVIIKFHPSMRFEQIRPFLGSIQIPSNFRLSTRPILELLPDVNVLVYNDGTFPAAEALAFGIPVVFVEPEYGLPLDSLDGFPEMRHAVRTPEEIANAVEACFRLPDEEGAKGPPIVCQLVGEVTDDTFLPFAG